MSQFKSINEDMSVGFASSSLPISQWHSAERHALFAGVKDAAAINHRQLD
jgi:hypothetical protein